jgi:hypothetical protein
MMRLVLSLVTCVGALATASGRSRAQEPAAAPSSLTDKNSTRRVTRQSTITVIE